jgi:DNA-directed RNA polymerase beta subunit
MIKEAMDRVTPNMMLASTRKLLDLHNGLSEPDDRDSLSNQQFYGPEDFFREHIEKDAGGIAKKILWNSTNAGKLKGVQSGALTPQLRSVILNSGLGQPIEEINPMDVMDQTLRVSRLGEGGIPSTDSIPEEARNVHPSQFGFIDPTRGPESSKLGVDTRVVMGTYKGSDGQIYSDFTDARTGKVVKVSARDAADKVLAFPGEMAKKGKKVRAMNRGKLEEARRLRAATRQ